MRSPSSYKYWIYLISSPILYELEFGKYFKTFWILISLEKKLANEKDSRSVTTYTAIEKTIKKYGNIKLYFSSPNVSNPEVFLKLFDRNKPNSTFKTNESPVSQNLFFIDFWPNLRLNPRNRANFSSKCP